MTTRSSRRPVACCADGKLVVEFSGAATVAALISGAIDVARARWRQSCRAATSTPSRALELLGTAHAAAEA
jgi:hypothetical protein